MLSWPKVPENVIVVLDEAYTEFTHPSERVNSFALLEKYPNLIVSRSLSKAYGLAGLRIGYAVSNPEIADLLNRVRQPFNCNSLALTSAIAVMNDDAFVEKVAENNRQEMKRYEAFCQQYGLDFIPSKGNFITIDFKRPAAPIYDALLREGVIVRPIAGYGMPNHLRISIGLPQENDKFFTALVKVLNLGKIKIRRFLLTRKRLFIYSGKDLIQYQCNSIIIMRSRDAICGLFNFIRCIAHCNA